jgi:hypothetical protein
MAIFWFVVGTILLYPVTWFFYVAGMHLKRVRDERKQTGVPLHWSVVCMAWPFIAVGLVLDALLNIVTMMFVFREFPKLRRGEVLVTARLQRHVLHNTWRGRLARWLCDNHLEPFDQEHCE